MRVCVRARVRVRACMYICVCACACACVCACACICVCVCVRARVYVCACVCIRLALYRIQCQFTVNVGVNLRITWQKKKEAGKFLSSSTTIVGFWKVTQFSSVSSESHVRNCRKLLNNYFLSQECPTGLVDEESFKNIFSQFFPQGGKYLLVKYPVMCRK